MEIRNKAKINTLLRIERCATLWQICHGICERRILKTSLSEFRALWRRAQFVFKHLPWLIYALTRHAPNQLGMLSVSFQCAWDAGVLRQFFSRHYSYVISMLLKIITGKTNYFLYNFNYKSLTGNHKNRMQENYSNNSEHGFKQGKRGWT